MYRQNYPDDPGMHNSSHQFTTSSTRQNPGFLERVGNSLYGFLIGGVIIFVSAVLLFWNEGRAVQMAQALDEGLKSVISLRNVEVVFDHNNGKLVHLVAPLQSDKVLSDPAFGVAVQAVKLKRYVEMYQWVEDTHITEIDGGTQTRTETTYSYSEKWMSEVIRSSSFHLPTGHHNPDTMPYQSSIQIAGNVMVGNFHLSNVLKEKINNFKPLLLVSPPSGMKLYLGQFYSSQNPASPQIGDIRVKFEYAGLSGKDTSSIGPPDKVTVIAKQHGNELIAYETDVGQNLEIVYMGQFTPKEIFDREHATNTLTSWAIRFAGWLLMFVGFGCLTSLFTTLVDWIPVVRELVHIGVTTMNLTFSISLWLTVIALGWIRYRPWLGCTILALAIAPFVLQKVRINSYNSNRRRTTSREL